MDILCILNLVAGGGRVAPQVASTIIKLCKRANMSCDIVTTQKQGDGTLLAQKAARKGYRLVIAAGGDGTINEVATGLVGTSCTLCIIPAGSGNGLARGLRIPLQPQEACRLIVHGAQKQIDVGQVGGRYFFATSGIGFDAHVGKVYNETPGHFRGLVPYAQIAITEFFDYTPENVIVRCNGKTYYYTPVVLTVANTEQYGGGAIIAPGAVPDDGLFDISIIPQSPVFRIVNHLPKLFLGTINTFPNFIAHKTKSLTVTRNFPGPVHVDGESFMAGKELEFTLLPRALNVQVPKKFAQKSSSPPKGISEPDKQVEILKRVG